MKMKIFVSILLLLMVACMVASPAFAITVPNPIAPSNTTDISTSVSRILGWIQFFGVFIAVGVTIVFGIKYIMASAQEKADLKGKALFLVIGILLLALAPTIVRIIYNAASDMNTNTKTTSIVSHIEDVA